MRRRAAAKATTIDLPDLSDAGEAPAPNDDEESPRSQRDARFAKFDSVAAEFKAFRPASEVLTNVRAVPTIFPQFDHATKVGGLPIERFTLLHGPSAGGKTYVTIAMMLSFLMRDHPVFFVDAERTTPINWLRKAMSDMAVHPLFKADKPSSYEQVRADVRNFCLIVKRLREAGKLAPDTSALIVIDSIRKLVPKGEWERIMKEIKEGGDGESLKNRSAQQKAAMNATWMDEITPLLDETGTAMIVIARETEDASAPPPRARPGFGPPPKVTKTGGGAALFYDASLDLRSERIKAYGKEVAGKFVSYGDVHKLTITKSKVSGKEQYSASCFFHISNGGLVPQGFDRARDIIEFARSIEVIEGTGWLKFQKHKWQGVDTAVKKLTGAPALLAEVEAECRAFIDAKIKRAAEYA